MKEERRKEIRRKIRDICESPKPACLLILAVLLLVLGIMLYVGAVLNALVFNKEKSLPNTERQQEVTADTDATKGLANVAEELPDVTPEKDIYNDYAWGSMAMRVILSSKNDVIQFYKSDDITEEQMKEYVEVTVNIINLSLSDSEIPPEEIEKYNDIIKEIPFMDYDFYQLKSTGENFRKGLKEWLIANSCWQIVNYYQEQIPEEKYNTFKIIFSRNIYGYEEENCIIIIDYGKKLIEDYIGNPDEVLTSKDWRTFTGMPEK